MNVVWTKPNCGYCTKTKDLLSSYNFKYEEKDIHENFEEFMALFPNAKTAPQIIFNGKHVGGYNELVEEFDNQNIFLGGASIV